MLGDLESVLDGSSSEFPDSPFQPPLTWSQEGGGERRVNETHQSTTDPDARLMRSKGKASKLSYQGHVLMENRNGLVLDARLTRANGFAERAAALEMLGELPEGPGVTLDAD